MAISICNVLTNDKHKDTTPYGNLGFPVACYEDDMRKSNVPIHWHDEYEYIFVTQGTITVLVNAEQIELHEGESLFVNSGCLHGVLSVTNKISVLRSLVVLPKFIGGSYESIIYQKSVMPLSTPAGPSFIVLPNHSDWQTEIANNMLNAWNAITREIYDFENEARYHIAKAMRILADHLAENKHTYKANDEMLERIKTCLSFIENNYASDISNQDLMNQCNCSESVLLRSFKQIVGASPQQYLIHYRIQKATDLLLSTDKKSCDIATACGFNDFSYFTKLFKQKIGMTPIAYRAHLGK